MPIADEPLFCVEGSTRRWDGYTQLARQPGTLLDLFARYMQ